MSITVIFDPNQTTRIPRDLRAKPKSRENLLVGRIMMFAIIDRKIGLFAGISEKRLAERFTLAYSNGGGCAIKDDDAAAPTRRSG